MTLYAGITVSPDSLRVGTHYDPGSLSSEVYSTARAESAVARLTISNDATGGPAVPILGLRPHAVSGPYGSESDPHKAFAFGKVEPAWAAVPPGGQVVFTFGVVPHVAAAGPFGSTYTIRAEVVCGDGSVLYPATLLWVRNPSD